MKKTKNQSDARLQVIQDAINEAADFAQEICKQTVNIRGFIESTHNVLVDKVGNFQSHKNCIYTDKNKLSIYKSGDYQSISFTIDKASIELVVSRSAFRISSEDLLNWIVYADDCRALWSLFLEKSQMSIAERNLYNLTSEYESRLYASRQAKKKLEQFKKDNGIA